MREPVAICHRISFSKAMRVRVLIESKGRCAICKDRCNDRWDVDHIIPRGNGGSNELENLQALCVPCHARKTSTIDRPALDKGRRQSKMGEPRPPSRIPSRKFSQTLTRGVNGIVRPRQSGEQS